MRDGERSALTDLLEEDGGGTLPLDPMTLPNRTAFIRQGGALRAATVNSASRLEAPMMLCGLTALSLETSTSVEAPWRSAACASV